MISDEGANHISLLVCEPQSGKYPECNSLTDNSMVIEADSFFVFNGIGFANIMQKHTDGELDGWIFLHEFKHQLRMFEYVPFGMESFRLGNPFHHFQFRQDCS